MRNEHLIEQFMKEHGIKFNQEFIVCNMWAYVKEKSKFVYDDTAKAICLYQIRNEFREDDKYKIIVPPFKPLNGENYFYVSIKDYKVKCNTNTFDTIDIYNICMNNCFKTEEEAINNTDRIKNKYKI